METTFTKGQEVYSQILDARVYIHTLGSQAAYVRDLETDEGHLLELSDLLPIDWDEDESRKRLEQLR